MRSGALSPALYERASEPLDLADDGRAVGPRLGGPGGLVGVVAREEPTGLADVPAAGRFCPLSVALAVAADLAARVAGLRAAHEAWIASLGAADEESRLFDACGYGPAGDSPAGRGCARTVRDLEEARLRLHALLDAAVRVGIFRPADSSTASPSVGAVAPAGGCGDAVSG